MKSKDAVLLVVVDDEMLAAMTEDWSPPSNIVYETFNTIRWNKDYSFVAGVMFIGPIPMERERAAIMAGAITGSEPAEDDLLVEEIIAGDAEQKILWAAEKVGAGNRGPNNPLRISVIGDYCPRALGPVKFYPDFVSALRDDQ